MYAIFIFLPSFLFFFLYINGKLLEEPYLQNGVITTGENGEDIELTVPEETLFLMGDNRGISHDSRKIGPVKKDKILGTSNFSIFPFNKFGIFK